MEKILSHLDGEPEKLPAFKRQWFRLHLNAYKQSKSRIFKAEQAQQDASILRRYSANLSKYGPAPDSRISMTTVEWTKT
jgi:hypothetical protein